MTAYFILQFNSLLLLLLNTLVKNKFFINILIVMLILFSGLRYGVGVDYFSYMNHFENIFYGYDSNLEYGIQVIVQLVNYLGGGTQFIFLIFSAFTIIFFANYIKYNTKNNFISWIIFISYGTFYLGSLNLVKQYIAISIFAFSIKFIIEKSFARYLVAILFASLFHISALILIPFYLLRVKFKYYHYIFFALTLYFAIDIFEYIISMTKYSIYLDERWANSMNNNRNIYMSYFFIIISFIILIMSKYINNIKNSQIFINMAYISLVLISLSLIIDYLPNMFFYRINNYFMISYIILPNYYLYNVNKLFKIIGFITLVILMYVYFILTIYFKGYEYNLIPYNMNLSLF
jgi:hypothetical protein